MKSVEGEELNSNYVKLAMRMLEKKIKKIEISYNGSGDSGDFENPTLTLDDNTVVSASSLCEEFYEPCSNITLELVPEIDFNNDGSSGTATFYIKDGVLTFDCSHSTYHMESTDTEYNESLVNTSML